YVLWFKNPFVNGLVTSTFVNPDSFSAYAGTGVLIFCGLILRLYRQEFETVGGSIRFRIANFISVSGKKGVVLFAGAFVTLVALLLTRSRGGIASTAFGLFVLGTLTLRQRKQQAAKQRTAIIIVGAVLVGAIFLVFGDAVLGKISEKGFGDEGRLRVYLLTI